MALAASELAHLVSRGPSHPASSPEGAARPKALPLGLPPRRGMAGAATERRGWLAAVDAALPDGGLPRGAVVEVASPLGLARSTSIAVAACAAAQRASVAWSPRAAWCAWVDPWGTLHAAGIRGPGLDRGGVDLERLLVVRPTTTLLARTATRVVGSGAFAVVVIDTVAPLGSSAEGSSAEGWSGGDGSGDRASRGGDAFAAVRLDRWPNVVRRLALAVEGTETIVLLLTDLAAARGLPLPVAMRVELQREVVTDPGAAVVDRSSLRIAKERHGRVAGPVSLDEDGLHPALRSATSVG